MHTVKCTNCEQTLTISKPVIKGKIRCPACGSVFVGTTHPVGAIGPSGSRTTGGPSAPGTGVPRAAAPPDAERPESPDAVEAPAVKAPVARPPTARAPVAGVPRVAAANPPRPQAPPPPPASPSPARPDRPPSAEPSLEEAVAEEEARATGAAGFGPVPARAGYRPAPPAPRKSNKAVYLYVMVGVMLVFLVVVVVVVAKYAGTVYYERRNEKGVVSFSGRVTRAEYDRMRQEDAAGPPVIIRQESNAGPARTPAPGSGRPELEPLPKMTPAPDANTSEPARSSIPLVPEDPKVTAMPPEKHFLPASTDTGFLAGVVTTKYDTPLKELRLTPQIVDSAGRGVVTLEESVRQFVPAGGAARYSADFASVTEDQIAQVRVSAKPTPMPKGEVCYDGEVNPAFQYEEKSVIVTGQVRNGGLKAIEKCYIYCEFYTRDWKFVKSAQGEVQDAIDGRLPVGRKSRFKVELALDEPDPSHSISHAVARVVGTEE